jgi:LacI family transcriptional regulator
VLNNTASVSDETRQKVEKIIRQTGYRSNMLAKSLRTNETRLVGILVEDITVWHTRYIIDGINQIAEEQGYNTILSNLRLISKIESRFEQITVYQDDINKALDVLLGMRVDGIIYVGMHDREISHVLHGFQKPAVYCYCYTDGEGCSVRYSNKKTAYNLTKQLIDRGYRRFGVINGAEDSEPAGLRFQGFCKALEESKLMLEEANIARGDWQYGAGREAALRMLASPSRPEVIVAMNDEMAVGVYDAARELGLRIPEDVAVTGFDNAEICHHVSPSLMTVDRPLQEMGYRAMEILLQNIRSERQEEINVVLPCSIVEGKSVRVRKE